MEEENNNVIKEIPVINKDKDEVLEIKPIKSEIISATNLKEDYINV